MGVCQVPIVLLSIALCPDLLFHCADGSSQGGAHPDTVSLLAVGCSWVAVRCSLLIACCLLLAHTHTHTLTLSRLSFLFLSLYIFILLLSLSLSLT